MQIALSQACAIMCGKGTPSWSIQWTAWLATSKISAAWWELTGKGVHIQFLKEALTFTAEASSMSQLLLNVMGSFAEFERALIRERQREGISIAKSKGVYKGRRRVLTPAQVDELLARVKADSKKAALAREFGVSRETAARRTGWKLSVDHDERATPGS
ncbi:DNA invertase Pin-like site-specific DNA recombinase [Bradyrhizobium yuanmingense]